MGKGTLADRLVVAGLLAAVTAGTVFCHPADGHAQDFTEAASAVGRGVLQIEFSHTFGGDWSGGSLVQTHTLVELLLRGGLAADWLELQVAATSVSRVGSEESGASETGIDDIYLGVRFDLTRQRGRIPALALLPQLTLPTGSNILSAGRVLPGVNLVYNWDVPGGFLLAGSTQLNLAVAADDDSYGEWVQSAAVRVGLGTRAGVYGEWYAFLPMGAEALEKHYFNLGLAWLTADDSQLDVLVGSGMHETATGFFVGVRAVVPMR